MGRKKKTKRSKSAPGRQDSRSSDEQSSSEHEHAEEIGPRELRVNRDKRDEIQENQELEEAQRQAALLEMNHSRRRRGSYTADGDYKLQTPQVVFVETRRTHQTAAFP